MSIMTDTQFNTEWKQALKICEAIVNLSDDEMYQYIIDLDISEEVKSKALKIINRMDEKNTVLDKNYSAQIIKNIEEDKDLVGLRIDNYQLIKRIALGGMSSIYEAIMIDTDVQNHVAIKILSQSMYSEKSLELFKREQIILSKLKHPSIVSFHHSGQGQDGMHYLVMEYIENARNIVEYCEQENLSTQAIMTLIKEVADVCTYFHHNLIIHRDIKADNILVDNQGRVKVIDFGIGQYDTDLNHEATQVFTVDSASPEQILGKNVTVQTDVFSLGALLLHLLVKQKPLPKTNVRQYNPSDDEKHVNQLLENSNLDNDLKNIIHTAMHIDTDKRYASMSRFAQDLENWQKNKPVSATKDSFFYRLSKFYKRNKLLTYLVFTLVVISFLSSILIYRAESGRQSAIDKKEQSLKIIRSVFQQANPLNQQLNESTINDGFNHIKLEQKALLEADPELKFLIYSEMAELYYSNNFYQKAIENSQLALQTLNLFVKPENPIYINNEAQLIKFMSSDGQYKESIKRGLNLIARLNENNPQHLNALVIAHLTIAQSHYILTEVKQAKIYLERAFSLIESTTEQTLINDILRADLINLKAVILRSEGNYDQASLAYQQSIKLLRNAKLGKKDLAINLTNFGVLKSEEEKYQEAEKYFLEAKQIIEELDKNHTQIAVINIQYATLLRFLKRYDEAQELLEKSLPILNKANDKRQLIWIYAGLTSYALNNNNIEKALINFENGYVLSKEIYGFDHPQTLRLLNKLIGIILSVPELFNVDELFDYAENQFTTNVTESQDFEDYQILKALHKKQKVINQYQLSQITAYLFDATIITQKLKKDWLTSTLENKETDDILKLFSHLWMQEFSRNEQIYIENCSKIDEWGFTYIYPLKLQLIELCIKTAEIQGFKKIENIQLLAESIRFQIKYLQPKINYQISNL